MSEFEIWQKYNLKRNPYFTEPLTIEGSVVPIETLVGRKKEKREITNNIALGGGTRFLVVGEAGVGKTSLVNFVRAQARKKLFFSPINEIKIQDDWTPIKLIIEVLQNLYHEIKSNKITLADKKLINTLEDLFEFSRFFEDEDTNPEAILSLTLTQVTKLYNDTVKNILNAGGYKGVIIHFNNLDNIDQMQNYDKLFNNLRDFFQNKDTIFIFVGFNFLSSIINYRPKVRQIFANLPIEVGKLSFEEILKIKYLRLNYIRLPNREPIPPHSENSIKLLYNLYQGNARDIFNSLSTSVKYLDKQTSPILIEETKLKRVLYDVATEKFLNKISPTEKKVLLEIIKRDVLTNAEISVILNKKRQHISGYIKKLLDLNAIKLDSIEGTRKFYIPSTEALWLKLETTQEEIKKQKKIENEKIEKIQESLIKYLK